MCNESAPFPPQGDPGMFRASPFYSTMPASTTTQQTNRPIGQQRRRLAAARFHHCEYQQLVALAELRSTTVSDLIRAGLVLQGWTPVAL